MKYLTKISFILFFLLVFCFNSFSQKQLSKVEVVNVNFCDLLKNPDEYQDKLVRITAIYRYGFEWQHLYCPNCEVKTKTWVEYGEDFDEKSHKKLKKFPNDNATIKVTLVGKLLFNGNFGDGGYKNQFLIAKIENAKLISKSSAVFEYLPEKDKAKISCSSESKKNKI